MVYQKLAKKVPNSLPTKSNPWKRLVVFFFLISLLFLFSRHLSSTPSQIRSGLSSIIAPTPTPWKPIENYQPPLIKQSDSYTILFVGDSMTEALGPNFDELRKDLTVYYPQKVFGLFNYGFGSTNIFTVDKRLHETTQYNGQTFPPILGRYSDIVIIESFAYNPLSEYPLQQGLIMQNETLNKIVYDIVSSKPNTLIIFLATIAPSKKFFGQGSVALSPEKRRQWAEERIAYLENHITYAQNHHIPLINVYEKSLDKNGEANLKYINSNNYIHPSAAGIQLISQTIADYFHTNNLLPITP